MPNYSRISNSRLNSSESDLIVLFTEVIKSFDNTIIFGYRDKVEQFSLFMKGRTLIGNEWVITDRRKVVTYKDGYDKMSTHNYLPSRAIDAVPYYKDKPHIRWNETHTICYFAGHVMATALKLKEQGKITHDIRWLGDGNMNKIVEDETFMDLYHYEIII